MAQRQCRHILDPVLIVRRMADSLGVLSIGFDVLRQSAAGAAVACQALSEVLGKIRDRDPEAFEFHKVKVRR